MKGAASRLKTQVLIIGGGVTGTGLARDLALRGVECIVVEKGHVNSGASGANHGLLHSGARYVSNDPITAQECRSEASVEATGAWMLRRYGWSVRGRCR